MEGEEEGDEVAPLPKIEKRLSRRQSEEKLRLDGLPSLSPPQERRQEKTHPFPPPTIEEDSGDSHTQTPPSLTRQTSSPPLGRLSKTKEEGMAMGGVNPAQQLRRRSSTGVYSPLLISTDASSLHRKKTKDGKKDPKIVQETRLSQERPPSGGLVVTGGDEAEPKRRSLRDERARRQLFALSADGKIGSRESAYMGWTPHPQLGQMKQRWEKEAGEGVRRRMENLLSPPRLTGASVPLEFRGLLPREPGRLTVWRQKVRTSVCAQCYRTS